MMKTIPHQLPSQSGIITSLILLEMYLGKSLAYHLDLLLYRVLIEPVSTSCGMSDVN